MNAPHPASTLGIDAALVAYHGFVQKMTSDPEALRLLPTAPDAFLRCAFGTLIDIDEPAALIADAFMAALGRFAPATAETRRAQALAAVDDTLRMMRDVTAPPSAIRREESPVTFDPGTAVATLRAIDDAATALGTEDPAPTTADALVRGILQVIEAQAAPATEIYDALASIMADMLFYFSTEDAAVLRDRAAAILSPAA